MADEAEYEIVDVYVVYTFVDEYGLTGPLVGIYRTKELAKYCAKGVGMAGINGAVIPRQALRMKEGYLLLEDGVYHQLDTRTPQFMSMSRERALKKLTFVERSVLGLK